MKPFVVDVAAPTTTVVVLALTAVTVVDEAPTLITPVQNALMGQQAMWPAWSRAQFVLGGQQEFDPPRLEQEL